MEALNRQMMELHYKVDQLHRMVETLTKQFETLLADQQKQRPPKPQSSSTTIQNSLAESNHKSNDKATEHKDILDDNSTNLTDSEVLSLDRTLGPDLQIQRLTAQLTAAYHRIAALEEQLMAGRTKF
jgi:uncharacterized coiled-coil protein SlyX